MRALLFGWLAGALLAVTNTYMALKTGFWESGCVLSALLAFGGLSLVSRRGAPPSPLETNLAQTAAVAVGAVPASAGVMGAVPAMAMLGVSPPGWAVAVWGVGLGALGIIFAFLMRRRLLEEEALPFPTGAATAQLISTLHASGRAYVARAWGLGGGALVSGVLTWLRDGRGLVPTASLLPASVRLGGLGADGLLLGIGWSPMLLGVGMLVGAHTALSLLLGSAIAWGGLAPWLVARGIVPEGDFANLSAWLLWPGVGLMVGAVFTSLASQGRSMGAALKDLRALGTWGEGWEARVGRWVMAAVLPLLLLTLAVGWFAFHLSPGYFLLTLLAVFPLCAVCARGAGQMDLTPISPVGQLAQMGFGAVVPGRPALDVAAGALVSGVASHTGNSLWSLQAGRMLGASPSRQLLVQLSGLALGAAVSVPTYFLLVSVHGLSSPELPLPTAHQFRVVADLASQGWSGLPTPMVVATAVGGGVGVLLSVLARGRLERVLPSAMAMGLGFLLPAFYSVTLCLGALGALAVSRWRASATQSVQAAGAGAIVAESLLGVFIPTLRLLGVLPPLG